MGPEIARENGIEQTLTYRDLRHNIADIRFCAISTTTSGAKPIHFWNLG
ncbi:MAG: hypothetical protein HOG03_13500 [Desulfobacula sp.]|nr:hypothetical protein [Desulfobacula sp.]MBT3487558.1 hypothetical protein [Desulfobacula sp.]MBT3805594.1 hypothetical protein [Desulfobacula sp.]MBT4027327.1 hypothetical protein [Desulfobacula sp.]MBT4875091.1 hypothetical protein [Desulfobacula sp.]